MSGLESIFSKDVAKVVSFDRKKELHEERLMQEWTHLLDSNVD